MTDARREGYWSEVDQATSPLLDLLSEESGAEWSLRGAAVTGESEDGQTLFVLVLRHRVGDAGLVVRLGYATVSLDSPEDPVAWSDNFLDMRIQGTLPDALSLLFSEGGMGDTQDPLALDARTATSPEEDAEVLTAPWRDVSTVEEELPEEEPRSAQDPRESVEHTETPETVQCHKCGTTLDVEDAENFGSSAIAGDVWVCSGGCDS